MLRPIPPRILRTTATVRACTGVTIYHQPTYDEQTVTRVHLQDVHELRRTVENTDVVLRAILYVDARLSKPALDYERLFRESAKNGAPMQIVIRGSLYTVASVDRLTGDTDRLHHWEIGLV